MLSDRDLGVNVQWIRFRNVNKVTNGAVRTFGVYEEARRVWSYCAVNIISRDSLSVILICCVTKFLNLNSVGADMFACYVYGKEIEVQMLHTLIKCRIL